MPARVTCHRESFLLRRREFDILYWVSSGGGLPRELGRDGTGPGPCERG